MIPRDSNARDFRQILKHFEREKKRTIKEDEDRMKQAEEKRRIKREKRKKWLNPDC